MMIRIRKSLGIVIISVITLATACHRHGGVLDGTHWKIRVTPEKASAEKGEKEYDDTLAFVDNKFASSALKPKGFKPSLYRGEMEENEAEFEIEQVSEINGVANWLGEVRSNHISGAL